MVFFRVVFCSFLVAMATSVFGSAGTETEEISSSTRERVAQWMDKRFWNKVKDNLVNNLFSDERMEKWVDKEFWNEIKDDLDEQVAEVVAEDGFVKSATYIIEDIGRELKETAKQTLLEMTSKDTFSFRDLYQQLKERSWQVLERGFARITELAKTEQEKFQAFVAKMGDAIGTYAEDTLEEATYVVAAIYVTLQGDSIYNP